MKAVGYTILIVALLAGFMTLIISISDNNCNTSLLIQSASAYNVSTSNYITMAGLARPGSLEPSMHKNLEENDKATALLGSINAEMEKLSWGESVWNYSKYQKKLEEVMTNLLNVQRELESIKNRR